MGLKLTTSPRVDSSSSSSSSNVTLPSLSPDKKLVSSLSTKSKNEAVVMADVSSTTAATASTTTTTNTTSTTTTTTTTTTLPPCCYSFTSMQQVAEMSNKLNKKNKKNQTWIVIDDNVHDVTMFLEHHPGGDLVIQNMRNKDCTLVFEAYHFTKLAYARAMLRRYCPIVGTIVVVSSSSDVISDKQEKYPKHVQHFRAIQQELYNSGMFQVDNVFYYKLYVWLAFLFVSSLYMTLTNNNDANNDNDASDSNNNNIYRHLCGALLLAFFWQQLAGLGHDLGHSNVSRKYNTDHWNGSIFGCSLSGISTAWWKRNHNTHHVVCNSVENDPDIQHLPTFAISSNIIEKPYFSSYYQKWFDYAQDGGAAARFMVSYQHYFLIPIMLVARFNMYAQSWLFLLNGNNKTNFRRHEMVALLVFATWYSTVALSLPTYMETLAWVLVSHACAGILHIQIIISHWAMETYRQDDDNDNDNNDNVNADNVKKKKKNNKDKKKKKNDNNNNNNTIIHDDDWYQLQLKTSMNIDCPPWMDWFHFGLQYQVEHHLFPSLPRHSLRHASRLVRQACRDHDIPYHHDTFYGALCKTLRVLRETAKMAQSGKFTSAKNTTKNLLVDALNCNG